MKHNRQELHIDGWNIVAIVDGDGHLTLCANHEDSSDIHDMGMDYDEDEYRVRLTTDDIERAYREKESGQ